MLAPSGSGWPERVGWKPGPPARPWRALVGPRRRRAGFGVSGDDQDPSGSRVGEGMAPASGPAVGEPGPGVPGPEAGDAGGWAGWSRSDSLAGARSWRPFGGDPAARRNHPAGGATPGQELSSETGTSAAGRGAGSGGWGAALGGWALASGWRGPGTIRPGGRDQEGMRFSGSFQRNRPVRCRFSSRESSGEGPILRFPLDWLLSVSITDPSPGTHFWHIPQCADPHTFSSNGIARG
jgi:hypothetical protein